MQKINYIWKFTLFYGLFSVITGTVVFFLVGQNLNFFLLLIPIFLVLYLITILYVNIVLLKETKNINKLIEKIQISDREPQNNYDSKISELDKAMTECEGIIGQITTKEIKQCAEDIKILINKFKEELLLAKKFKINRGEFLGNVAHELRTPIFTIQLSIETLLDGALKDEKVNEEFLRKALKQTVRLTTLVDDLISISNLESGMKIKKEYFALNSLVKEVINEMERVAHQRKIMLEFDSDLKKVDQIYADPMLIKQVLTNLIDNSIKYNNTNGFVKCSTIGYTNEIKIIVEDNGIGIPHDDIPRIFERFYRVDKNRSRETGGSGLGLSIVKHILELHNSKIQITSRTGEGTKVEFTLPRTKASTGS